VKNGGDDLKLKSDKTKEGRDIFAETCSSIINGVIIFFLILLMLVFPLIYNNTYIDILVVKYQFYWGSIVLMLALCLVLSFNMLIIDNLQNKGKHAKILFSKLHPKKWSKTFSITDVSVIIFWIILVISTFQSDYFRMDILHFHEKIATEERDIFTSTVGNINIYTAYIALVLGVSAALFGFLPLILFKSKTGIKRYLLMIATFGTVVQCIAFINQAYAN
jgi:hypothetical protein